MVDQGTKPRSQGAGEALPAHGKASVSENPDETVAGRSKLATQRNLAGQGAGRMQKPRGRAVLNETDGAVLRQGTEGRTPKLPLPPSVLCQGGDGMESIRKKPNSLYFMKHQPCTRQQ